MSPFQRGTSRTKIRFFGCQLENAAPAGVPAGSSPPLPRRTIYATVRMISKTPRGSFPSLANFVNEAARRFSIQRFHSSMDNRRRTEVQCPEQAVLDYSASSGCPGNPVLKYMVGLSRSHWGKCSSNILHSYRLQNKHRVSRVDLSTHSCRLVACSAR